jgi:uncharacterized protein
MTTVDVVVLPGIGNSGPEHWQSQWERRDPGCVRLMQAEWDAPSRADWMARLQEEVERRASPVVLAAHSSACALVAHWVASRSPSLSRVKGALLVAPSDPTGPNYPKGPSGFAPVPLVRLPFRTIVVTSTNDPYVELAVARRYAEAWGAELAEVANAGHLNVASGHGPWPEGYALLQRLRG